MTDKQIIFKCDVDCIRKNTEECFELDCIKGQESILKQLKAKEQECVKLKQTLVDIKPILEVYADTKIGIEQPNGTYSMEIKDDKVIGGTYTITYNPNLAKTALDKINEVI